jgi:hypothetical protein
MTTTAGPVMAGQYFNVLAQQLEKHKNEKTYTLSKPHFGAVQELEKTAESNILRQGIFRRTLILHRLTPKLSSESRQVGPPVRTLFLQTVLKYL